VRISRLRLTNWRNFRSADLVLSDRAFIIGPNACGKSNLLDAFRFLHDLVATGGGLRPAVDVVRGGARAIRSLHAGPDGNAGAVRLCVDVAADGPDWSYELAIGTGPGGRAIVREEIVRRGSRTILRRPTPADTRVPERHAQTGSNRAFRALARVFATIEYTNLVPQVVREGQPPPGTTPGEDPLGRGFLERIGAARASARKARLARVSATLRRVVPQFDTLAFERDAAGRAHLLARFRHWRGRERVQNERQFSDGMLRLIAMLWMIEDAGGPLLLDEPEWSLHTGVLRSLAPFLASTQRRRHARQVIISTHSETLLSDPGIAPDEVVLVQSGPDGSTCVLGADHPQIRELMDRGIPASEAALPISGRRLSLLDEAPAP
jgi:predicted ATPase